MDIANIKLSKGFFITVVIILIIYFLIPALSVNSAMQTHDKFVSQEKEKLAAQQQAALESLNKLGIEDPQLRECIKNTASQYTAGMETNSIQRLYCPGQNIRSIKGLGKLRRLTFLDLSDNAITSISPISDHPNLETVKLGKNPLRSINPLSTLPSLQSVQLTDMHHLSCIAIQRKLKSVRLDLKRTGCRGITGLIDDTQAANKPLPVHLQRPALGQPTNINTQKKKKRSTKLSRQQEEELFEYENDVFSQ